MTVLTTTRAIPLMNTQPGGSYTEAEFETLTRLMCPVPEGPLALEVFQWGGAPLAELSGAELRKALVHAKFDHIWRADDRTEAEQLTLYTLLIAVTSASPSKELLGFACARLLQAFRAKQIRPVLFPKGSSVDNATSLEFCVRQMYTSELRSPPGNVPPIPDQPASSGSVAEGVVVGAPSTVSLDTVSSNKVKCVLYTCVCAYVSGRGPWMGAS